MVYLRNPPRHVDSWITNCCWLVSLATFLQVSYYEAHCLAFGGPPLAEGQYVNIARELDWFEGRLKDLGFVRARKDYMNADDLRFVVACARGRRSGTPCATLHCVVWDPRSKRRLDPAERDTFLDRGSITKVVRVFRRPKKKLVTGVVTHLARVADPPKPIAPCSRCPSPAPFDAAAWLGA